MECYFPGRILVGPGPESQGSDFLISQIIEQLRGDFEFDFSINDVLKANDVRPLEKTIADLLPFVGRVPEGAEEELSTRIATLPGVGAATPDYLIYPNAPIKINTTVLNQAIGFLHASPGSSRCGQGCKVGILDSGIDPSIVSPVNAHLHPYQYDAHDPTAARKPPADATGHGSLIARIISEVAPGAELISIRAFDRNGTISSVIAALYLAEATGPCDVINLSLSVSCAPVPCFVCKTPTPASANIPQLNFFFETFMHHASNVVLVAAAGNNVAHLTLPAAFNRIIAVGSFDYTTSAPISKYHQVPANRFVLAPGGKNSSNFSYAERNSGVSRTEYLHGTSFATAFVTGFAAKTICSLKSSSCGTRLMGSAAPTFGSGILASILREIEIKSDRSWFGFSPAKHGLGVIRF